MDNLEDLLMGMLIGVVTLSFVLPADDAEAQAREYNYTPTPIQRTAPGYAPGQHYPIYDDGMRVQAVVRHPYEGASSCEQTGTVVRCDNGYNGPVVR